MPVGRPMSPGSVAGMNRRSNRRTRRRTAAVVGGAAAVAHGHSKSKQAEEAAAAADQAYEQGVADAQAASQQAQPAQDDGGDAMAELEKLGQLHEQGILTDEEFAAKKQELLARM